MRLQKILLKIIYLKTKIKFDEIIEHDLLRDFYRKKIDALNPDIPGFVRNFLKGGEYSEEVSRELNILKAENKISESYGKYTVTTKGLWYFHSRGYLWFIKTNITLIVSISALIVSVIALFKD